MREFDLIAVLEGQHPSSPLPDLQMVVEGGLTAVLSASPRPLSRPPRSLRHHLQAASRHLSLQTTCMYLAPLLPVRLDTALHIQGAVDFLTANQPVLTQLLARHAGMTEVQVSVSWDEASVRDHFATDPEIAAMLLHGATAAQAVQHMALRLATRVGTDLARLATELAPLPLASGLLYNATILLPVQKLGDLTRHLADIQAIWPAGLTIRQIGPGPIRSFATLDLIHIAPREIEQAMAGFGMHRADDLGSFAAARRRRIMAAGHFDNADVRAQITDQAEILAAAARLHQPQSGFALCRLLTERQSSAPPARRAVA